MKKKEQKVGDPRRFDLFARMIQTNFPQYKEFPIADVAGGKGYLRGALLGQGFSNITTIDKRHRLAKGRPGTKWGHFTIDTEEHYSLVAAMHPDEATDHAILYAAKHFVPFIICPCCIRPSARTFWENYAEAGWHKHLINLAQKTHEIVLAQLKMTGKNKVLIGIPKGR